MANKQYLDRNGVSHFYLLIKNKLTEFFKTLFVAKKDGYDLSQNDFTNELKRKLENITTDGAGGYVEKEIIIISTIADENDYDKLTITAEDATILKNYNNEKPIYLQLDSLNVLLPYVGMQDFNTRRFNVVQNDWVAEVIVNVDTCVGQLSYHRFINNNTMSQTIYTTDAEYLIPSVKAVRDYAIELSTKGVANGVATLNASGKIPSEQLPSFVDDVVEGYYNSENGLFYTEAEYTNLIIGEGSKIYIDLADNTNNTYRWSGNMFVRLESSAGLTALSNTEIDEIIASVDSSTE